MKGWLGFGLASTAYKMDVVNYSNLKYWGPVYMGTPGQKIDDIIWDTGSPNCLIESSACPDCPGNVF